MLSTFTVYLELGFDHIADTAAFDHVLFVVALSAGYTLRQWKELLVLVTAFTVGHSLTLALATLRLLTIPGALVEFLIPLTIVATAGYTGAETWRRAGDPDGVADRSDAPSASARARLRRAKYVLALVFGLIHGLGFSNFLRAVLGEEESIGLPLFSFNVGLELGQIVVLALALGISGAALRATRLTVRLWTLLVCAVTSVGALVLLTGRIP